uniref:Uncharacterized protein n=1 Tax=Rhizophora mucronata TaxID=61149 RepID=A0A2P2P6V0_RHIMU
MTGHTEALNTHIKSFINLKLCLKGSSH